MEERFSEWHRLLQSQTALLEEIVREQDRRIGSLEQTCGELVRELAELKAGSGGGPGPGRPDPVQEPVPSVSADADAVPAEPDPPVAAPAVSASVLHPGSGPYAGRPAWQTDLAGMPVEQVRKGLSLNDRIVLMRELFDGNPASMDLALDLADRAGTLDEFVAQMRSLHPDWDEASDSVYRFYMLARRKIRK